MTNTSWDLFSRTLKIINGSHREPGGRRFWIATSLLTAIFATGSVVAAPDMGAIQAKAQTCIACHASGIKLGNPPISVPTLEDQHAEFIVAALEAFKNGKRSSSTMSPIAASLSNDDIHALGDYFNGAGLTPQRPPDNVKMPKVVLEVCESCHGRTGMGVVPEVPVIGGQHSDYLSNALHAFRSEKRKSAVMGSLAASLSDEDITAAANFFSQQAYLSNEKFVAGPISEENRTDTVASTTRQPAPAAVQQKVARQLVVAMSMVDIKGGIFEMGSNMVDEDAPGYPKHAVTVQAFRLAAYPVTFAEYDVFAIATGRAKPDDEGWGRDKYPVINVDWNDTMAFIMWLNKETGRRFRLPSEAEWEYAAHAGTSTNYWWGDQTDFSMFNSHKNVGRDRWLYTSPVGSFPASPWGLYDMTGNVFQRVADCRHASYVGAPTDGSAWITSPCLLRIMRGGSWHTLGAAARARARTAVSDVMTSDTIGFRLAEKR
ncbi:SUMF1/EgtB/PvdO family nonheme iron enzyme [Caballeronia sordidicola]|uniref:Serine/threonine kinase n=1 Tax=Caballeronia sordidicola TaxID=196367 RepID=A0A226X0T7_CABSO|nr:SUMF1/EgtB/PvdO family nonheme iron enzyme [Caballeronia sordidicola]OXC76739.1 serine/threonine kinase [Caballeronia sordidicola]